MSNRNSDWWKKLQPLRLASFWYFTYNKLEPTEPDSLSENDDAWLYYFTEDILQMTKKERRKKNKKIEEQTIIIDLGWYPECDPKGTYKLVAILNEDWENPLLQFTSRSTKEIVKVIEHWSFDCFRYFIENTDKKYRGYWRGNVLKEQYQWECEMPLRIPPYWKIIFNKLELIEADDFKENDDIWLFYFVQDIFSIRTKQKRKRYKKLEEQTIIIDLGWYPDGDPKGAYALMAVLNDDWLNPLLKFTSRNTKEVIEMIEYWLFHYFSNGYIEEGIFRKFHKNKM